MKYYYRVYGVNIESKIEVPEFEVIDSNSDIDVKLSFGVVDEEIIDLITQGHRAKYEKQAIAKMKNAGYKLQPKGDGKYILTAPNGTKSLITRPDIDLDGGASWMVLTIHLTDNKPKFKALY